MLLAGALLAVLSRFEERLFDSLGRCVELLADIGLEASSLEEFVHDLD